jgi:hypothetical protein
MRRGVRVLALAFAFCCALVLARPVQARQPPAGQAAEFSRERRVSTAAGEGQRQNARVPQRLAIDQDLLTGSSPFRVLRRGDMFVAEQGLADLRFFTSDGRPVPHLLMQPPAGEPEWIAGRVLAIAATKKSSGFEIDLGTTTPIDRVRIEGLPAPFLKRVTLEASGDRARWTMLVDEGTLFDLPDEGLRQDALGFAAGDYRYLRVTWNDANSGRVPAPRLVRARRVATVPAPAPTSIDVALERRPSEPGVSRYRIRLPAAMLPIVALDLDVSQDHVYRRAIVSESRLSGGEAAPVELGTASLARVTREGITASALRVPIAAPSEAELELTIEDGENPPLDVRRASVALAQLPWIYLEAPESTLVARYGNPSLERPTYDLEAVRDSIDLSALPEAKWSGGSTRLERAETVQAAAPLPLQGATLDPGGFRHVRALQPAAGLVALPLDAHALAFSRGPTARFADVRVIDASNRQIPYVLERRNEPISLELSFTPASDSPAAAGNTAGSRQRSVYAISLPHANLPPATLVVETSARVFQRTVRIGIDRPADRQRREPWFDVVVSETWRHADEERPARPLALRLPPGLAGTQLRLVIDEGDNQPLPIAALRLLLPSYRLRFYPPAGSALRLVYGRDDLLSPQYDLALLAPRVMGAAATETSAASASSPLTDAEQSFVAPRTFWLILGAAVLVLLGLIVKLVRRGDATGSGL